jgi:hypothetical protein
MVDLDTGERSMSAVAAGEPQGTLPIETPQRTWAPPVGKNKCSRDPAAGPGSCWYWWEMCPKAEQRGCYLRWLKQQPHEVAS